MKHFISIADIKAEEIKLILDLTAEIIAKKKGLDRPLDGKMMGLVFQKPSNRTRVSFEVGMVQLGGHAIYLGPGELELGVREAVKDIARVLSGYLDVIVARTFSHKDMVELAQYASIPVINGLSDLLHPAQAMSDVFTIKEKLGRLEGVNLAYVGDGNNVLNSLINASSKLGINLTAATPKGYEPNDGVFKGAQKFARESGAKIKIVNKADEAVDKNTDVIYTDVWVSMGQEAEAKKRLGAFKSFQVNEKLLAKAKKDCLVMHCLPAHRGEEITDAVLEGPNSVVFRQAINRLHVQKAILLWIFEEVK